jgi:hypothetical protein
MKVVGTPAGKLPVAPRPIQRSIKYHGSAMMTQGTSAATVGGLPLDARGRLDGDLSCAGCEYNLRGMLPDGDCPECGRPVRDALEADRAPWRDRAWRRRMTWALWLLAAGNAVAALASVSIVLWFWTANQGPSSRSVAILPIGLLVGAVFGGLLTIPGVWLFRFASAARHRPVGTCRTLRVSQVLMTACWASIVTGLLVAFLLLVALAAAFGAGSNSSGSSSDGTGWLIFGVVLLVLGFVPAVLWGGNANHLGVRLVQGLGWAGASLLACAIIWLPLATLWVGPRQSVQGQGMVGEFWVGGLVWLSAVLSSAGLLACLALVCRSLQAPRLQRTCWWMCWIGVATAFVPPCLVLLPFLQCINAGVFVAVALRLRQRSWMEYDPSAQDSGRLVSWPGTPRPITDAGAPPISSKNPS